MIVMLWLISIHYKVQSLLFIPAGFYSTLDKVSVHGVSGVLPKVGPKGHLAFTPDFWTHCSMSQEAAS